LIFEIIFAPAAERNFYRLAERDRERVETALDRLALTGQGDVRPLSDYPNEYRLRVGQVRVRFRFNQEDGAIDSITFCPGAKPTATKSISSSLYPRILAL
jgi:mRNA-degrading endonuclease RelE of RelBE toxin-antitoxin system